VSGVVRPTRNNEASPWGVLPSGTFVIVPAYNEARTIGAVLSALTGICTDLVVVDDGSRDETPAIARRYAPYVLRHMINRGQGAALQTGIEFALQRGAKIIVTFDADGQHSVRDIDALVQPIAGGECEITLGSRFLGRTMRMPLPRRMMLKAAILFTQILSQVKLTDTHNGLRAFSRRSAERIVITNDRMAHASELIDIIRDLHMPFREVPVKIRYTKYSLAKGQSMRGATRVLFDYVVGRVTS